MKKAIKIIIAAILFVFAMWLHLYTINIGKTKLNSRKVAYTKESKISYLTYLKDNNYYDDGYIQNGYNLVADLIDYFNLDYNYTYTLSEKISYELNYNVMAILDIYDGDNDSKPIDTKEYILLENQTVSKKSQIVKVDIHNQKVMYDKYNEVIQSWKKKISPNAKLKIVFNVSWTGYSDTIGSTISDKVDATFIIPISEKIIDIKTPTSINESDYIVAKTKLDTPFMIVLVSSVILLGVILIYLAYTITGDKEKSKYDTKIAKILREFDRAITRVKGKFVEKKDYVEVMDFMELLDAHDNLGVPIMHYRNSKNINYFVVKAPEVTYFAVLKRKDFE